MSTDPFRLRIAVQISLLPKRENDGAICSKVLFSLVFVRNNKPSGTM